MLRKIVLESHTRGGQAFDWSVIALILYSTVAISLETLPGLSPGIRAFLAASEGVVAVIFTLEYALRIFAAPRKAAYLFSFYGIVDFLSIVPFWLSFGTADLRVLRTFRLFRIFRLFKLVQYNRAMDRFARAFRMALEESVLFLFTAGLLIYISAMGIWHFEHAAQPDKFGSVFMSLGWALGTLTAGEFVDVIPLTPQGRILMLVMLVLGIGVVAVPAGLVATALAKVREDEDEAEPETKTRA